MKGWVYVISNKGKPGLVKVGYSSKDPTLRAKELDSTADPYPHMVDYEVLVEDPYVLEQKSHAVLKNSRIFAQGVGTEWFKISSEGAVAAIRQIAQGNIITEDFKRTRREEIEIAQRRQKALQAKEAEKQAVKQEIIEAAKEEKKKREYLSQSVEKLGSLPAEVYLDALSNDRLPGNYDAWTLVTRMFGNDKPTEIVRQMFMADETTQLLVRSHQGYLGAKSFQSKDWQREIDTEFEKSSRELRIKLQNKLDIAIKRFYR